MIDIENTRLLARRILGYQNICRVRKWKRTRQLDKFLRQFHDPESFYQYTQTIGQDIHLSGSMFRSVEERRAIFTALFNGLCIDLKNKSFLDLGPGSGESLDVAKELGAVDLAFADYDPYILGYNILKGYRAFHVDYMVEGLKVIPKFDVVVTRGSINADRFNRKEVGVLPFDKWLRQLENLATSNGLIIVCPTFDKQSRPNLDGYSPYQWVPDLTDFDESLVNETFLKHGFKRGFVKGFNEPAEIFPFTFIKN